MNFYFETILVLFQKLSQLLVIAFQLLRHIQGLLLDLRRLLLLLYLLLVELLIILIYRICRLDPRLLLLQLLLRVRLDQRGFLRLDNCWSFLLSLLLFLHFLLLFHLLLDSFLSELFKSIREWNSICRVDLLMVLLNFGEICTLIIYIFLFYRFISRLRLT